MHHIATTDPIGRVTNQESVFLPPRCARLPLVLLQSKGGIPRIALILDSEAIQTFLPLAQDAGHAISLFQSMFPKALDQRSILESAIKLGIGITHNRIGGGAFAITVRRFFDSLQGDTLASRVGADVSVAVMEGDLVSAKAQFVKLLAPAPAPIAQCFYKRTQEILASVEHDYSLLGLEAKIESARDDFRRTGELFERVIKSWRSGWSLGAISRDLEVSRVRLRGLLDGELPFSIERRTNERRLRLRNQISIPIGESVDFAFLLGVHAATVRPGGTPKVFIISDQDHKVVAAVESKLRSVFGENSSISRAEELEGDKCYHKLYFYSHEVMIHINEVTASNTRVPWEHLQTKKERVEFLRGLLARCGTIVTGRNPYIEIVKTHSPLLIQDIGRIFGTLDMIPIFVGRGGSHLRFSRHPDLVLFQDLIGFPDDKRSNFLAEIIKQAPSRRSYSLEQYDSAIALARKGDIKLSSIASIVDVSLDTLRDWIKKGKKPDEVTRTEKWRAMTSECPDADVIAAVYRDLGGTIHEARLLAEYLSIKEYHRVVEALQKDCLTSSAILSKLLQRHLESHEHDQSEDKKPPTGIEPIDRLIHRWSELSIPHITAEKLFQELVRSIPGVSYLFLRKIVFERLSAPAQIEYGKFINQPGMGNLSFFESECDAMLTS